MPVQPETESTDAAARLQRHARLDQGRSAGRGAAWWRAASARGGQRAVRLTQAQRGWGSTGRRGSKPRRELGPVGTSVTLAVRPGW